MIKHIVSNNMLYQYFLINSFSDFYLDEMFLFYRKLNDFISNRYLDYPVKEISPGKKQFRITYDISDVEEPEYQDINSIFTFNPPTERNCNNCEFMLNKFCKFYDKKITEIIEKCPEWYEKEL